MTVMLSSKETEYLVLLEGEQELKFVNMLLEGNTEVHKPSILYEYNQGVIFLANNTQAGMHTKAH